MTAPGMHVRKRKTPAPFPAYIPPDWKRLLLDLRASAVSFAEISRRTGTSRERLYSIEKGLLEPFHSSGENLLALHRIVTGKEKPL